MTGGSHVRSWSRLWRAAKCGVVGPPAPRGSCGLATGRNLGHDAVPLTGGVGTENGVAGGFAGIVEFKAVDAIPGQGLFAQGKALLPGKNVSIALRCIPAGDAIFDASSAHTTAPQYQSSVSYNSFRFLDSAMHFRPSELNVLLRSLPAPPMERRLFFSSVVACRRRLAKRWEQTPLAKLFTLEDEWSMLKQRAQAVRVREAIKARGLLLHDAFAKFDYSRTGMLTLDEVFGALDWLGVQASPEDVLFFVRSISRENHISYKDFMELLCPPDEEESLLLLEGGGEAGGAVDGPPLVSKRQISRVPPKGSEELAQVLKQHELAEAVRSRAPRVAAPPRAHALALANSTPAVLPCCTGTRGRAQAAGEGVRGRAREGAARPSHWLRLLLPANYATGGAAAVRHHAAHGVLRLLARAGRAG